MKSFLLRCLPWVGIGLICANGLGALGQANVNGVIVDSDGAAVPNIALQLETPKGSAVDGGSTTTDAQGRFRLVHVAPGDYQIDVPSAYGFEHYQSPVHIGGAAQD